MKNSLTLQIEFQKPRNSENRDGSCPDGDIYEVFQVYQDEYELHIENREDYFLPSGTLPFS